MRPFIATPFLFIALSLVTTEASAFGTIATLSSPGSPVRDEQICIDQIDDPEARIVLEPHEQTDADTRKSILTILDQRAALATEGECSVSWTENGQVVVELSGVDNPFRTDFRRLTNDDLARLFGGVGQVEFVDTQGVALSPGEFVATTESNLGSATPTTRTHTYTTLVDNQDVKTALLDFSDTGDPNMLSVVVEFKELGQQRISEYTAQNVGNAIAVTVDNRVLFSPEINAPIGDMSIFDGLRQGDAVVLAAHLTGGPLPAHVKVIELSRRSPT